MYTKYLNQHKYQVHGMYHYIILSGITSLSIIYYFTKRGGLDKKNCLPLWYLQTLLGAVVVVIVK